MGRVRWSHEALRWLREIRGYIRILLYGHYRIAYLVTETRDVQLLGIYHGALDIDRYLE